MIYIFRADIFLQRTPEEWQNVFYVAAGVAGAGGIIYTVFGKNEREKWAIIDQEVESCISER